MRLTLRTLLAYLDDILEPADHEELKQKIEASEFATDLVHRTRDTMRRLRLSAPQVIGAGIGLDANSVSEYLDNTLPPDSVADFERICLESEMHLAEVVSCHHVLTMVLGEPAEVDSDSRQRMYKISEEKEKRRRLRVEPAHVVSEVVASEPTPGPLPIYPPVEVASYQPSATSEIPDYLRASRWSPSRIVLAVAAVLLIAMAGYWLFGLGGQQSTSLETAQTNPEPPSIAPEVAVVDRPTEPPTEPTAGDTEPPGSLLPDNQVAQAPTPPTAPPQLAPPANVMPTEEAPLESDDVTPPIPTPGGESETARSALPTDSVPPVGPIVGPGEEATSTDVETAASAADVAGDSEAMTEPPMPAEPPAPVAAAFYVGGEDVLAQYDPAEATWNRLTPRTEIMDEGRLLTLPAYRSRISLPSGIDLALTGGTLIDVKHAAAGAAPGSIVEVVYGRLLLVNTAAGEAAVALVVGDTATQVRLQQNTTLAVEVKRPFIRGQDPRQTTASMSMRLFAMDGGVSWGETKFTEPTQWTVVGGETADVSPLVDIPEWIDRGSSDRLEEMAARRVEERLTSDRPLPIQLQELFYEGRRAEDKSLAARSSVYVGQFGPFVEALRDPEQRNAWSALIQSLRDAMALSADSAEHVRNELVKQRGEEAAADLYEMLCGYDEDQIGQTPEQMKAGAIATLVDRLEHEALDYRVLAFHDLMEITGKNLAYVPTARADERARRVRTWRQRLEDGELGPRADR